VIRGYPGRPCVAAGERLTLHVSTDARRFRVRFLRCGAQSERMHEISEWFPGEAAPSRDAGVPWEWPAYTLEIPSTWRGGAYVAVLEADGRGTAAVPDARSARALFTVRSERARPSMLVVLPLFTYHAYNVADVDGTLRIDEGACLYSGAPWVSLHRPGGGTGGHPWDEVNRDVYDPQTPRQTFAHWDAKALAWLEAQGYEFECVTDLELHAPHFDLSRYRVIVSFGHHEYWTQEMRDRLDAYIDAGGNVAFFGGNTCWFRAEYDETRQAVRRAGRWTETPEWKTTGVSYACGGGKWIGPRPPTGYTIRDARHWAFAGANVSDGETFGDDARLIGYECDGAPPETDLYVLADASIRDWPVADGSGEVSARARATMGIRKDNGTVFTASTVDWARVLHAGDPIVERITHNVLRRLLGVPDAAAHVETSARAFR
jgi:hypothetical protein